MKSGIARIIAERKRQIEVEAWTPDHDKKHHLGELAIAGACYAVGHDRVFFDSIRRDHPPMANEVRWPWAFEWWKPSDHRERELDKAGALIVAEEDRLLYNDNPEYDPYKEIIMYDAAPKMLQALELVLKIEKLGCVTEGAVKQAIKAAKGE